jgi:hypothetical protein
VSTYTIFHLLCGFYECVFSPFAAAYTRLILSFSAFFAFLSKRTWLKKASGLFGLTKGMKRPTCKDADRVLRWILRVGGVADGSPLSVAVLLLSLLGGVVRGVA